MGSRRLHRKWYSDPALVLECLTKNIYYEARGESLKGKFAVAHVTINRSKTRNKPICGIVYEARQFSWTHQKQLPPVDRASSSWIISERVALFVLLFPDWDVTKGSQFYHAVYVSPSWKRKKKFVLKIDNHLFYR